MVDFAKLASPLPPEKVSWRIGQKAKNGPRAMALAYIDARDVMERLDQVCGPQGWQATYPHANGKTVCSIGIKVGDEWVWKANGAGDTDIEAEKGALSDAFKRAAVMWGIGRYLYDVEAPWVETEGDGKFAKIAQREYARLRKLLPGAKIEGENEPSGTPAGRGAGAVASHAVSAPTSQIHATDASNYVTAALPFIRACPSKREVDEWWASERPARVKYGIAKGTVHFSTLWDACDARVQELEQKDAA